MCSWGRSCLPVTQGRLMTYRVPAAPLPLHHRRRSRLRQGCKDKDKDKGQDQQEKDKEKVAMAIKCSSSVPYCVTLTQALTLV